MAMNDGTLGISFAPTNDEDKQRAVGSPLQQAIQILKLHLPRFAGSRAPVPQELLGQGGGGPGLGNSVVESVLARILGQGQGVAGMAPAAGAMANPVQAAVQSQGGSIPTPSFSFPVDQAPAGKQVAPGHTDRDFMLQQLQGFPGFQQAPQPSGGGGGTTRGEQYGGASPMRRPAPTPSPQMPLPTPPGGSTYPRGPWNDFPQPGGGYGDISDIFGFRR